MKKQKSEMTEQHRYDTSDHRWLEIHDRVYVLMRTFEQRVCESLRHSS
jgi:hypothetical protein